jgi:hypothetical protein
MDAVKPLNYAPRPPKSHRRLKRFYQFIVICAIIAAGYFWGPGGWRWGKYLYWQYQACRYLARPDHIAVEETRAKIVTCDKPLDCSPGTFFLHELRRPDGISRLIEMDDGGVDIYGTGKFLMPIQTYVVLPIGFHSHPPIVLQSSSAILPNFTKDCKYFAGQPDPINQSHFTFVYESDGKKYTIDCWLKNDDRLVISPRP